MKNILIHGLGQNNRDWDTIKTVLEARGISSIAPDLFDLARGRKLDYPTVYQACLLYTSPSPRDRQKSRMPSSA